MSVLACFLSASPRRLYKREMAFGCPHIYYVQATRLRRQVSRILINDQIEMLFPDSFTLDASLIRLIWNPGKRSPNRSKKDILGANTPYPSYALLAWDTSPLKFSLPARKRKLGLAALMNLCSRFLPFTGWTPGRKLLELRARALGGSDRSKCTSLRRSERG